MKATVLQHKVTKRYLSNISLKFKSIETVVSPHDAKSWDMTSQNRKQNLKKFLAHNETLLGDFEVVQINISLLREK